ncbi:MAG: alpha/beta hydrolase [Gemmatimonadaceae bacterium]|nr:alpha/beta hydrolase [Gemmatimonadaceae bacterium]
MIALVAGVLLAAAPAPADTVIDTVFVVSNRRRVAQGFTREVTDSLWYGLYVTRLVVGAANAPLPLAQMHVTRVDSIALTEAGWRVRLASAVRDTSAQQAALVYVHGYSSSPGTAVAQGVQVRARGGHTGPLVVFLWPTHELYVVPTPVRVYRNDARAAARSGPALARVMRAVDSLAPGAVLVAHSMGSRVALDAVITDSAAHAQFTARPLRAMGIFSPDVSASIFRETFAPQLPGIARRVALYGASRDYLLGASAIFNRERRAAGIARRGDPLPGIELVDDSRGARAEPLLLALAGPAHAVRWASAAVADFFAIVVSGADPTCRLTVGTADDRGAGRWRLRRGALPPVSVDSVCRPVR